MSRLAVFDAGDQPVDIKPSWSFIKTCTVAMRKQGYVTERSIVSRSPIEYETSIVADYRQTDVE